MNAAEPSGKDLREHIGFIFDKGFSGCRLLSLNIDASSESLLVRFSGKAVVGCNGSRMAINFIVPKSESRAALSDLSKALSLTKSPSAVSLLLLQYASPDKQKHCKELGLHYIDKLGNAWVNAPGLIVDKQGFKPERPKGAVEGKRDFFSDKATLVLRLMLKGQSYGVREISSSLKDAGFAVSPGYVTKVLQALRQERYASSIGGSCTLSNRRELLDDWAAYYKKQRRSSGVELFYPAANPSDVMQVAADSLAADAVFTGLAGASFLDKYADFDVVRVMVRDIEPAVAKLTQAGAKPVGRGANIQILLPYYKVSAFYDAQEVKGMNIASLIQLYLDLVREPIRGIEAAEHLLERYGSQILG